MLEQGIEQVIVTLLQKPIAFHRIFVDIAGSAVGGLFLSQVYYWRDKGAREDGYFYKTFQGWREEIGLTRSEFERARKSLKKLNILESRRFGTDPKLYYRLNLSNLFEAIRKTAKPNPTLPSAEFNAPQCRIQHSPMQDPALGNAGSCIGSIYTENTNTENNTENTYTKSAREKNKIEATFLAEESEQVIKLENELTEIEKKITPFQDEIDDPETDIIRERYLQNVKLIPLLEQRATLQSQLEELSNSSLDQTSLTAIEVMPEPIKSPGCNTEDFDEEYLKKIIPRSKRGDVKKYYELKQQDFAWIQKLYSDYRPSSWGEEPVMLTTSIQNDLKRAYRNVEGDMGTLHHFLQRALIYCQNTASLWNHSIGWLLREERFLEIGQRSLEPVAVPTHKLKSKHTESQFLRKQLNDWAEK